MPGRAGSLPARGRRPRRRRFRLRTGCARHCYHGNDGVGNNRGGGDDDDDIIITDGSADFDDSDGGGSAVSSALSEGVLCLPSPASGTESTSLIGFCTINCWLFADELPQVNSGVMIQVP